MNGDTKNKTQLTPYHLETPTREEKDNARV